MVDKEPVKPEDNNKDGVDKVQDAKETVERMEAANLKQEELLDRQERLQAEKIISGDSEAGTQAEPEKEETAEEYSKRVLAGDV